MRALACGVLLLAFPAMLGACAVDASSPVSDEDRVEIGRGVGASDGVSSPPVETEGSPTGSVRTAENHKTSNVTSGDPGLGPTSEPTPQPWKGSGPGKGTQKKDGPLHTKIRDMIEPPDDGHDP